MFEDICLRLGSFKTAVPYLILAAICAVYLYPFVRVFNNAPDSGIYLNGADLLNRGAIPSRDFVELQGPGSFVWLALFFRLFGTTLETARTVLNGTGIGIGLLTFYLSRKLGASGVFATLFVVTLTVPLLPMNNPHYDSNLFALAALAVFVKGKVPAKWALVVSAALCGVTTWMIQQKGCYLAVGLVVSLVWMTRGHRLKPAALFSGVYASVALLPFAIFAALHALPDVIYANYIWPVSTYSSLNAAPYGFPIWQNLAVTWGKQAHTPVTLVEDLVIAMPFIFVAALPLLLAVAAFWAGARWFQAPMIPYWTAALALWAAELHRMDMGHLRNGVVMMAVLFFAICEAGGKPILKGTALVVTMCVALAGASQFALSWETGTVHETRRGAVRLKDPDPLLDFLELNTKRGEDVFVYPYQPIYYFAEGLRNPTRYSNLTYGLNTGAQFREATQDLERKKVRYVVFDTLLSGQGLAGVFPAYRQPEKATLIMEPYLEAHYRLARDLGRFRILERIR